MNAKINDYARGCIKKEEISRFLDCSQAGMADFSV